MRIWVSKSKPSELPSNASEGQWPEWCRPRYPEWNSLRPGTEQPVLHLRQDLVADVLVERHPTLAGRRREIIIREPRTASHSPALQRSDHLG